MWHELATKGGKLPLCPSADPNLQSQGVFRRKNRGCTVVLTGNALEKTALLAKVPVLLVVQAGSGAATFVKLTSP